MKLFRMGGIEKNIYSWVYYGVKRNIKYTLQETGNKILIEIKHSQSWP